MRVTAESAATKGPFQAGRNAKALGGTPLRYEGRGEPAKTTPFVPQGRATPRISSTKTDYAVLLHFQIGILDNA